MFESWLKVFQGLCWVVLIGCLWAKAIIGLAVLERWREEWKEKKWREGI